MNFFSILQLVLGLATGLLSSLKLRTDVPQEIINDIEAAIALFQKVQGSTVTMGQLEDLRLSPAWGDAPPPPAPK